MAKIKRQRTDEDEPNPVSEVVMPISKEIVVDYYTLCLKTGYLDIWLGNFSETSQLVKICSAEF